jgi:tRNA pseudouridine38-40 synthase
MPTYKLTLEYEGTRYSGWQTQSNTPKTVQGHVVRVARQFLGDAEVGGAGRTDAGVHAVAQVAHLRCRKTVDPVELRRTLNDLLPHDINILRCDRVSDDFHARHDAESRVYLYQVSRRRTAFAKSFVWWLKDSLDVSAIQRAGQILVGRHDFAGFADKRLEAESTDVVVERVEIGEDGDLILIRIIASHYLWKMVRKIVAALVEVGRGRMPREAFETLVGNSAERFSPTAPPSGLFLEAVTYPGEIFDRELRAIVPVTTMLPRRAGGSKKWAEQKKR